MAVAWWQSIDGMCGNDNSVVNSSQEWSCGEAFEPRCVEVHALPLDINFEVQH